MVPFHYDVVLQRPKVLLVPPLPLDPPDYAVRFGETCR